MTFSERLKKLRKAAGLTQLDLAKKVGMSRPSIANWERGTVEPDIEKIALLSDVLNTTTDYLVGSSESSESVNGWKPSLTARDHKDIDSYLDGVEQELSAAEGMLFDGEPATKEDVESIINAMRVGVEMAKLKNKEKYTPKKYRK